MGCMQLCIHHKPRLSKQNKYDQLHLDMQHIRLLSLNKVGEIPRRRLEVALPLGKKKGSRFDDSLF
jgi:hypothetical protein